MECSSRDVAVVRLPCEGEAKSALLRVPWDPSSDASYGPIHEPMLVWSERGRGWLWRAHGIFADTAADDFCRDALHGRRAPTDGRRNVDGPFPNNMHCSQHDPS